MFQNVAVWDPIHNTDHYLVLGCLYGVTLRENQRYLGMLMWLPLYPPKRPSQEDYIFASLRQTVPKTPVPERAHASWISEETWKVINTRVSLLRPLDRDQLCLYDLGSRVWFLLDRDRWR